MEFGSEWESPRACAMGSESYLDDAFSEAVFDTSPDSSSYSSVNLQGGGILFEDDDGGRKQQAENEGMQCGKKVAVRIDDSQQRKPRTDDGLANHTVDWGTICAAADSLGFILILKSSNKSIKQGGEDQPR